MTRERCASSAPRDHHHHHTTTAPPEGGPLPPRHNQWRNTGQDATKAIVNEGMSAARRLNLNHLSSFLYIYIFL